MKAAEALGAVAAFELYHGQLEAELLQRAKLLPGLDPADLEAIAEAVGGIGKVEDLARVLPETPAVKDMVAAFGDAKKLGAFIGQTLGGNIGAMAALVDRGCGRDPAKLAGLATAFEKDPAAFRNVLEGGGLGSHPEALAEIFASGCSGKPDELITFCKTFDDETKRGQLSEALGEGGLGQAPAALGVLAQGDGGALLLKVAQTADRKSLKTMLAGGGLGGRPPDHPGTLAAVLKGPLAGDPARLKELHDAFPNADGRMPELQRLMQGLNGKSEDGTVRAGDRMQDLMEALKRRDPSLSNADLAKALFDPYFKTITARSADAGGLDASGGAALKGGPKALADRPAPPKGRIVGGAATALKDAGGQRLLDALTSDPAAAQQLAQSRERIEAGDVAAKGLDLDTEERAADPGASEATQHALEEAKKQTTALQKLPAGGTPEMVDALTRAAEACFERARGEPGAELRRQATEAGTAALAEARAAMRRQAEQKIAALAGADAQLATLAAAGAMQARIDADPTASAGEKAAMAVLVAVSAQALGTLAEASQVADPTGAAAAVRGATARRLGKDESSTEVGEALAQAKKAALAATAAAKTLRDALTAAPPPVDPQWLARAGAAAEAAVRHGKDTDDAIVMKAALDAGRDLSTLVAQRGKEVAAAAELSLACAQPEARPALVAATDIGALESLLAQDLEAAPTGSKPAIEAQIQAQRDAALAAQRCAVAAAELARLAKGGEAALAQAADAEAGRQAALDGHSVPEAQAAAKLLAEQKAQAAKLAADAIKTLAAPIDPVLIRAAMQAAEDAASAAAGTADKVGRGLALSEGARAASEAAAALGRNAKAGIAQRATAKAGVAETDTNACRAEADTYVGTLPPTNRSAVRAALDKGLGAIGAAGAAQLAEFANADPTVQDARAAAAVAAAQAGRPGAGHLVKLQAVKADAEAQQALATLAVSKATTAVTGLATAASVWPPAGPTPYVQAPAVAAPTEAEIRHATILCDAAISACTKWVAAATAYADAARAFLRLADLVPDTVRSTAETLEHAQIKALHNDGNDTAGAPKMRKDAQAALLSVDVQTSALADKASALMKATQIARVKFNPPGNSHLAANTTLDPSDPTLENAAGFAAVLATKAYKTVNMPNGTQSTTPPSTAASLLASGTNTEKKARPTDVANPNPPPPRVAVGAAMPISGHPNCELNLEHMLDRHCRTHFTFDPGELMAEEDVLMSAMVSARTGDLPRGAATETTANLVSANERDVRRYGTGKTTTLWPEGVSADQIAAAATLALVEIKKDNTTTDPMQKFVYQKPKHQHSRMIPNIAVGPLTLEVSLGISATGPLGTDKIKVVMFYPVGQESLTVADCHTIKAACKIP